jgi:hypothetical protein
MLRRAFACLSMLVCFTITGCKVNQGNGEAKPQNSGPDYNQDYENNNTPKRETSTNGAGAVPAKPGPAQTPSQPASKTNRVH